MFLSSFYLLLLCSLYSTEWNGRTEALSHGAVQLLEAKKRSFREDDGSNEDIGAMAFSSDALVTTSNVVP